MSAEAASRTLLTLQQEWKSVESHTGGIDARLEANVASLTKIASLKEVPPELRVLPCLGAFKTSGLRYGLVYQLPFHLRDFRRSEGKPGDLSRRRKPTSLLSLLQSPDHRIPEALDLGSRIKLAQGIAQSLLLLQSVEWVHKKYVLAPVDILCRRIGAVTCVLRATNC